MAKEISIIRQEAQQVQNATQVGENTAQRVGGVLTDIVDKAEEHETDIDNLNANTGVGDYPVFSASTAYSAGVVVNYQGKLYQFTADHAAGAWTGTDAEKYNLINLVNKLHILLDTISEYPCYNVLNPNKCLFGTYIDKDGNIDSTEVSGYFTIKIKAPKEGLITLFGSTSFATYLVIKKDGSKRQIKYETKQEQVYTYQEDDEYVIVGLRVDAIDDLDESQAVSYIASNIGVYLGSSLPNKFIPYSITKDVQDNIDDIISVPLKSGQININQTIPAKGKN